MPDATVSLAIERVRLRWRLRSIALAVAMSGAVLALSMIALSIVGLARTPALFVALLAAVWQMRRLRSLSTVDAAMIIEARVPGLDNLIVSAAEIANTGRAIRDEIRSEIDRQATLRLGPVDIRHVVPLAQPIVVAAAVVIGCALLAGVRGDRLMSPAETPIGATAQAGSTAFTVRVSPPAYTRRADVSYDAPLQISVIAGSRVRIATSQAVLREWVAAQSEGIEIRPDEHTEAKFLAILVVPDAPPSLRVVAPGKDSAFLKPTGQVAIHVESTDDLGMASLTLHFTKASGGGENLTFTDGEAPLTIDRRTDRHWIGRATLTLDALNLADGDVVVYRAVARDTNPLGAPVQSEQYLIEIGKTSELADAGFALPAEEKKYAISQQMVIYKTEQLIRDRAQHPKDWLEQTQTVAVEQRMVRAEVVFLGGGEVEDELEEAARSDELTEGRLQNAGRAEMLRAINAMSRAEAQLNDGKAVEALVFEREALASLERALDRRRYFLRTLPERSRIDVGRRLTGERHEARSWLRDAAAPAANASIDGQRAIVRELVTAAATGTGIDASLAARITAIDPQSPELQQAAVAIAGATSAAARREAVRAAMQAVTDHALKLLPASAAIDLGGEPLSGSLADAMRGPRR